MIKNIDYYMSLDYKIEVTPIHDQSDSYFRVSIPDLPGLAVYEDTVEEALTSLEEAKRGWISVAMERKLDIAEPFDLSSEYSGRMTLRLSKSLHRSVIENAKREGVSANSYLNEIISQGVTYRNISYEVKKAIAFGFDRFFNPRWSKPDLKTTIRNVNQTDNYQASNVQKNLGIAGWGFQSESDDIYSLKGAIEV